MVSVEKTNRGYKMTVVDGDRTWCEFYKSEAAAERHAAAERLLQSAVIAVKKIG